MSRFDSRQLVATMILALSAALTASVAGEAPKKTEEFDAPPPMPYVVPAKGIKAYVKRAVELPSRPPVMTVHDYYRKPAEVLQFSNIKPGMRIVEMSAYGNYWSLLLSEIIGPKGELYMYDPPFAAQLAKNGEAFVAKYPNSKFQNLDYNQIEFPKAIDMVWCFACFHELLLTETDMDPFLSKLYKNMKPGAAFMVVFYTARDGSENQDVGSLHRLDASTIRGTIQAGGFRLDIEDRQLENREDDHKTKVFSEAEGDLADRLIYRFIKPV